MSVTAPANSDNSPVRTPSSVSQLKTVKDLESFLDRLKRSRHLIEQQWKLNLAFYKGRQYAFYNKASRRFEQLPQDDGDKPRFRVRLVSNQVMTGSQSLLSKYTKTRPVLHATPGTGSDKDLKAAQMADKLLEFWWQDFGLDSTLEDALLWGIICGQGYWEIDWDEHAGKQMSFLLGPDGQPIVDAMMADLFKGALSAQGVQPQEQTVYLGDICVNTVSPFDLYLDNTVRKFDSAKYAVRILYLDPDTVWGRYKQQLPPDSVSISPDAALPTSNEQSTDKNVVMLKVGYFKPSPAIPKGRIVTWHKTKILEDKPWDLPTHDLPYVKFPGIRVPGQLYDSSVVEHAIPLQKELNRTLSQIVEYKNLTIKPQWMAPTGSLRTRMTNEPGAVFSYTPIGGLKPEAVPLPSMPAYVFEHLATIKARLDDVFGLAEVTEGSVPPNVEAGVAIDLLQEMATDRLAPTIRIYELALGRAGRLMLALGKQYYTEPRLLKIRGSTGSMQVQQFTQSDIDGAIDVICEGGSGLPRTRAGRQARVEWMMSQGLIPPGEAYKYLDTADLSGLSDILQLNEDQALREQDRIVGNQPVNPYALNQAQQACQQAEQTGINPDTNQPFQDAEEYQEWCQQAEQKAADSPNFFDDHQTHIEIHGRWMKTVEYEGLDPQQQGVLNDHMMQHFEIMLSMPASVEPIAPRTTLQIKATTGPDGMSQILKKAGVNVTPEQASEPPIETWVSEDLSKPQAGDNQAADEVAAAQQAAQAQQQMEQEANEHGQKMAQGAQQMAHAHQAHQMQMAQQAHAVSQAEQKAKLQAKVTKQGPPPRAPKKKPSGR